MTSKISFESLLPRECMSRYFFENFFHVCKVNTVQTKVHFKNLQFLAVAYDMGGFKLCFRHCQNGSVFFLCLSNF